METAFYISELMDGLGDETLALFDGHITSPDRILTIVRQRGARRAKAGRRPRRLGRVLLIAAVLAALMSVTAYAVYELVIDQYVIDRPAAYETPGQTEADKRSRVSLVGYQGTPEYMAYTEWEAWRRENPVDWNALGLDDGYCEVDAAYRLYGCSFQYQADALDAIIEKYGLTLHTQRGFYRSGEDLYDALGTGVFYGGVIGGELAGYVYENGSFKTEGDAVFADGRKVGIQGFTNVKGSFADITLSLDLRDYEEWSYETASGVTVDLVLASEGAEIMAETDGAYINLGLMGGSEPNTQLGWAVTKGDLEALADSVDFAVLAERFDGTAHPETAGKVAALDEKERARTDGMAPTAVPAESADARTDQQVMDELGTFDLDPAPEGFALVFSGGGHSEDRLNADAYWDDGFVCDHGAYSYDNTQGDGILDLDWYRFYTGPDMTATANEAAFEKALAEYASPAYPLIHINGCKGFATDDGWLKTAVWLDQDRDILFKLESCATPFTADDMAAMAATVTETEPMVLPEPTPPLPTPLPEGTWTAPDLSETLGDFVLTGLDQTLDWDSYREDMCFAEEGFDEWRGGFPLDMRHAAQWSEQGGGGQYESWSLFWSRSYEDYDRAESATASAYAAVRDKLFAGDPEGEAYSLCQVGEYEGFVYLPREASHHGEITWLDGERDLQFSIQYEGEERPTAEALIAMAESVAEVPERR